MANAQQRQSRSRSAAPSRGRKPDPLERAIAEMRQGCLDRSIAKKNEARLLVAAEKGEEALQAELDRLFPGSKREPLPEGAANPNPRVPPKAP